MTTLIGPADGGVGHVSQCLFENWPPSSDPLQLLLISDDGQVTRATCACARPGRAIGRPGSTALRAARAAWWHRRCLRQSSSLHVELGRTSVGAFWFTLAAAVLTSVPVVVTTHDIPTVVRHPAAALVRRGPGFWDRLAYRLVAPLLDGPALAALRRRAAATVVLTTAAAVAAREQSWTQVTQVDHGAAPRVRPGVRPGSAGYVLLAGYLGPGKGLDVLAAAWPLVSPPMPLVIAGGHSSHHAEWVAAVRAQFDSGPNPPTWLGYVDDAEFDRQVQESAVVVIPYEQSNPASGVLVRALVEGRAVVATRVAAVVEEVTDGVNGLLVPPGDAVALGAAISRVTASAELRDRLGGEAARRAAERHSWATHATVLSALHRSLVRTPLERRMPHHV